MNKPLVASPVGGGVLARLVPSCDQARRDPVGRERHCAVQRMVCVLHAGERGTPRIPEGNGAVLRRSGAAGELPPRMRQTLDRLLAGQSEKEIAVGLGRSKHTVHVYVKALYRRYGVCSRGELLARWVQPR